MVLAYIKSPELFISNEGFEKRPMPKIIEFYLYLKWLPCTIRSINFMKICIHDAHEYSGPISMFLLEGKNRLNER